MAGVIKSKASFSVRLAKPVASSKSSIWIGDSTGLSSPSSADRAFTEDNNEHKKKTRNIEMETLVASNPLTPPKDGAMLVGI